MHVALCTHSLTDKTADSGSADGGSIPLGTLCSKEGPTKWEDALLLCAAIAEGNFHAAHPVEVGANKSRAREDALLLCAAIAAYLC